MILGIFMELLIPCTISDTASRQAIVSEWSDNASLDQYLIFKPGQMDRALFVNRIHISRLLIVFFPRYFLLERQPLLNFIN